ncbi:MAG TPA: SRPBCC family protein [Pseudomonadales bacterium]|nr:SRPBCC family protein [Pseudomonadales bacterium]
MGHIAVYNATAKLPAQQAWLKLKDLSLAHNYVPGINKCVVTTDKKEGVGASRRVSGPQQALDETVTEWNEGRGFTIRLHNGNKPAKPFGDANFTYRIDKIDDKTCKLTCTMTYEMGMGFLGGILHSLFLGNMIRNNIRDVTLSMAYFYETGKTPSKDDVVRLRAEDKKNAKPFP